MPKEETLERLGLNLAPRGAKMKIAIMGAGAIGCVLGGYLCEAGEGMSSSIGRKGKC